MSLLVGPSFLFSVEKEHDRPLHGKPLRVGRIPQSFISESAQSESPEWYEFHTTYDRFSVKVSTVVKPEYSQVYTFSTNLASCEIWVDGKLVVGHGQMEG